MSFLYPLFTLAALSIAIPVLIHLFNFKRYKKVFFPDIRFLKELQEQTKKQSQLRHLLILACRILTILFLVLAFAQPLLTRDKQQLAQGPRALSIYVDNSYSMALEHQAISRLDQTRAYVQDIIQGSRPDDRFHILTNEFGYNENRFLNRDEALRQLGNLRISPKRRSTSSILEKQKQLLLTEPDRSKQIYFLSDFQKNQFDAGVSILDSIPKFFVPVQSGSKGNISLDTAYFEQPALVLNENNPLQVRLSNHSDEEVNTTISVQVNRQMKSVTNVQLKPGEQKTESVAFSPSSAGSQNLSIFIHDYPVSFDDTFHIAARVNANYSVLVLNPSQANAYLTSVFKPGSQFRVDHQPAANANTQRLSNYALIILNGTSTLGMPLSESLKDYLVQGGNLLVFAPAPSSAGDLNNFLSETAGCQYQQADTGRLFVTSFNRSHTLFQDLFVKTPENIELPQVFKRFSIQSSALSSEQKLFSFSNSESFLSVFNNGNGRIYVCASPADAQSSSFPKSYWFLPLIYKMAYQQAENAYRAITLGPQAMVSIPNQKAGDKIIYHLGREGIDVIPEQRSQGNQVQVYLQQALQYAGIYSLYLPGTRDSQFVGVNYPRTESDLALWDLDELKEQCKIKQANWLTSLTDFRQLGTDAGSGMPLWKVCLILAALFLLTEILLIRFMR